MKLRTRLIVNRTITFVIGALLVGIGLVKDIESFLPIGIAMIICTALMLAKQWKVLTNSDKMKELENTYNDERVIFIAHKSYSFAFWVSVYTEFIGMLIMTYLGLENIPVILSMIICFQVLTYVAANVFYNKKY